jgi:dolichol-phosphate mannosyltransferase
MKNNLSIIIPTLNERGNIETLVAAFEKTLGTIDWQVIFVDDNSSDGTAELVDAIGQNNPRVRCIKRATLRGLSSACIDGAIASEGRYVAIMDADLQHDPQSLNEMLNIFENQEMDLVIGSRYISGGEFFGWSKLRLAMSYLATFLAQRALKARVKDPLSGFFMFRRLFFETNKLKLSAKGSKILMDLLMSAGKQVRFKEIPITFKPRFKGHSKHSWSLVWANCQVVIQKIRI